MSMSIIPVMPRLNAIVYISSEIVLLNYNLKCLMFETQLYTPLTLNEGQNHRTGKKTYRPLSGPGGNGLKCF